MEDIIIVGGGIGGLISAIRLLNKGYKVTIFEKGNTVGGKVNIKEEQGFKFDLTATILMTASTYIEVFKSVGRNYRHYFELVKLDTLYNVYYHDKSEYKFYTDLNKLDNVLEAMEEGLSEQFIKYLNDSHKKYLDIRKSFLTKPMDNINELIQLKNIKKAFQLNPTKSTEKYIDEIISNEKLREYLMFQAMYIGINSYESSNLYLMIPTISQVYGLYYVKGGFYNYILALQKLIYELGGSIKLNSNVEEIIIENKKAIGVRVGDKVYKSSHIICNVDYPYAMKNLFNTKLKFNNIDKREYSYSVFIIYLGLKKKYENLNIHNIYIGKNLKDELGKSYRDRLSLKPSFYFYYPSSIDNSFCHSEKSVLNIMVRVPNLKNSNVIWNKATVFNYRNIIINEIKSIKGLEDIEENIEYESYLTPLDLKNKFNSYYGTAFGLSHKLNQTLYFRPHIKSKHIKNLYFIGSSTHPGNGVSIIIEGSKILLNYM